MKTAPHLRFPRPPQLALPVKYALAVLITGVLFVSQEAVVPQPNAGRFVFLYLAVVLSAWLGGRGPGLVATVLSAALATYFAVPPIGWPTAARDYLLPGLFVLVASVLSIMAGSLADALANEVRITAALRKSERDYRLLFETAAQGVVYQDSEGTVLAMNAAAEGILGRSRSELVGQTLELTMPGALKEDGTMFPASDRPSLVALRTGREVHGVVAGIFNPRENGYRWISIDAVPLFCEGESKPYQVYGIFTDVTERRRTDAERARLLAETARANEIKDLFLATLSHELRTPLGTILAQSQILKKLAAADPRIERPAAIIERSAVTQARLIDDLLDISRIAAGKLQLDMRTVDLREVVKGAAELARPAAEAKSLHLEVAAAGEVAFVRGDAARLQQVVTNLLANAIKFTPRGGRVVLRLERAEGRAQIVVADSGIGIRPEFLPRIFARFAQADSSPTRSHSGLGLGLSIVQHLVQVHGGEVRAESAGEGKGATFRVTLPLDTAAPSTTLPRPRPIHDLSGVRVLLVEDEDDVRESFSTVLEQLGAEVRAASSAAAGLAAFDEFHPQVVLCDLAMPGEDGYSFIRKLRGLGSDRGGQVPAAALTALVAEEDRTRAIHAGFQIHLAKPIDAARLAAAVGMLAHGEQQLAAL